LNEKLEQIQDESRKQAERFKQEQRKLEYLLEEKSNMLEKDYVKLSYHDELIHEKNNLVKRLDQEIRDKEYEMNNRLKELELRLTDEFNAKQAALQRIFIILRLFE